MIGGKFITRAYLEVNGKLIEDFGKVSESPVTHGKKVNLMNGSGYAALTKRYEVTLDYKVPTTGSIDWSTITNGTLTIEYRDGNRVSFGGVNILEIGEASIDGENELTQTIRLSANDRNGNLGG
jgi:hypothetical protein